MLCSAEFAVLNCSLIIEQIRVIFTFKCKCKPCLKVIVVFVQVCMSLTSNFLCLFGRFVSVSWLLFGRCSRDCSCHRAAKLLVIAILFYVLNKFIERSLSHIERTQTHTHCCFILFFFYVKSLSTAGVLRTWIVLPIYLRRSSDWIPCSLLTAGHSIVDNKNDNVMYCIRFICWDFTNSSGHLIVRLCLGIDNCYISVIIHAIGDKFVLTTCLVVDGFRFRVDLFWTSSAQISQNDTIILARCPLNYVVWIIAV